jgi:hypothetical protein
MTSAPKSHRACEPVGGSPACTKHPTVAVTDVLWLSQIPIFNQKHATSSYVRQARLLSDLSTRPT